MPEVEFEMKFSTPVDEIWRCLNQIEAFPALTEDVRSVEIVESSGNRRVSMWTVVLLGSPLSWTEEELIDDETYRIDFRQLTGDLANFVGYWQIVDRQSDEPAVRFYVDFETGIPSISDTIDPIASRLLRENFQRIATASLCQSDRDHQGDSTVDGRLRKQVEP